MWHSDSDANVKGKRLSRFTMKDYFGPQAGPNKTAITADTLKNMAAKAYETIQQVKKELEKDHIKVDEAQRVRCLEANIFKIYLIRNTVCMIYI